MDIPKVGVDEKHLRALGVYHGEIKHGIYHYSDPSNQTKLKEEVRYWTKDPVYVFIQTLEGVVNKTNTNLPLLFITADALP